MSSNLPADRLGGIEGSINTDGVSKFWIRAYKFLSGSEVHNTLGVEIDKNGNYAYIVSAPAAFRAAIDAVCLSGDTMTNSLNFSSSIDLTTRPSNDMGITRIQYFDANGNVMGGIRETHSSNDGTVYNKIITRRVINSNTTRVCELGSGIKENGDYTYIITSPEAFRNTLNVNCRINTTTVSNAQVIRINVPKSSGHMFIATASNVPSRSYVGLVTQTNNDAEAPRELRIAVGNATTVTFGNCMMTLNLGATATAVTVVDIITLEGSSFATVEKVS